MADGALTLHLDTDLTERLRRAAKAAGADVATYAAQLLDDAVGESRDWAVDDAIAGDTVRRGDGIPLDAFLERMDRFGRPAG